MVNFQNINRMLVMNSIGYKNTLQPNIKYTLNAYETITFDFFTNL